MTTTIEEINELKKLGSGLGSGTGSKSKKNKSGLSAPNKSELWSLFESEIQNPDKQKDPLECLYRVIGDRESCEMCKASLAYSDEGFSVAFGDPPTEAV